MSTVSISNPFKIVMIKIIFCVSWDTTEDYNMEAGGYVTCPPAAKHALHVKSILMSKLIL
jgi:hypothetical protein